MESKNLLNYEPLDYKREIENFSSELTVYNKRCIVKKIIFIKSIFDNENTSHYKKCIVFDLLSSIFCLERRQKRYYFFNIRSSIENLLRIILELTDEDSTGVNELFKQCEVKFKESEEIELFNYIKGEYTTCCDYVHSNISSNISIDNYYCEIIRANINEYEFKKVSDKLETFLKKICEIIIIFFTEEVYNVYYKKINSLKILLNKDILEKYKILYKRKLD
ncbi:hypothetical protein ACLD43_06220 [Clostridium botulinum]|uniref:hypothetical protein n=1 Tax=Clostridium botulinum TaxID=1491 RepID=UPI003A80741E